MQKLTKDKYTKQYALTILVSLFKQEKILLDPSYQRESVWTRSQKQLFIDSILNDIDIPKLYFRKIQKDGHEFEVVDGQQRLRSVFEFFNGEFPLADETDDIDGYSVAGMKFEQLPTDVQTKFQVAGLDVVLLNQAYEDEDIEEMFTRLQNGTPLNAAEKRRAYAGQMRHVVTKLSKHRVFELCGFSPKRYAYEDAAAKILHIFIKGSITDIKPASIKKTYEDNQDIGEDDKRVKAIQKSFNFIVKSFEGLQSPRLKKYAIITMTFLVHDMMEKYNLQEFPSDFGSIYLDFELKRAANAELAEEKQDPELVAYSSAARSDSIPDMEFRHRLLFTETLKGIPELERLDDVRTFSDEQRLSVYWREKGKCQSCGKSCDQSDFHVDHIIPYSKGGKTKLANAQLLCPTCNLKKGKKT